MFVWFVPFPTFFAAVALVGAARLRSAKCSTRSAAALHWSAEIAGSRKPTAASTPAIVQRQTVQLTRLVDDLLVKPPSLEQLAAALAPGPRPAAESPAGHSRN